jgi:hypothetical protein
MKIFHYVNDFIDCNEWMFKWMKKSVLNNIEYNVIHSDFKRKKKDEKKAKYLWWEMKQISTH